MTTTNRKGSLGSESARLTVPPPTRNGSQESGRNESRAREIERARVRGPYERFAKPLLDRLVALALLVLLSPVLLIIAVAVLTTGWPVLIREERIGRAARVFKMVRFRTMRPARYPEEDLEERLTPVGRLLTRFSLDELPQLFNVMVGHMSLVGPRPERLDLTENYEPWQHRRHQVRPGCTGLWQVSARGDGRYMHENTEIDVEYVENISLLTDLRIIWHTLPVVLRFPERPSVIPGVEATPMAAGRTWGDAAYLFVKRLVDLVGSLVLLILLLPFFLVVGVAIKLDSEGPVIFRQTRVGYRGHFFQMLKLRTMEQGADPELHRHHYEQLAVEGNGGPIRLSEDPRVTRVGRFLRKWSMDELPNLWNVLKGEMSLVGPRPFVPYEVDLQQDIHVRRMMAKPGITGLAQVAGRSDVTLEDRGEWDVRYVEDQSALLDTRIMARTFTAVWRHRGD